MSTGIVLVKKLYLTIGLPELTTRGESYDKCANRNTQRAATGTHK
jgi:hypothetical protein